MPVATARRNLTLAALVVLTGLSIAGLTRLRFAYDIDRFFPQDDPAVAEYALHKARFGDEMRTLLVGLELANGLDRNGLEHVARATMALEKLPFVTGARSVTTIGEPMRLPLGEWITVPFFQTPYDEPEYGLARLKQREEIAGIFLARDGKATTVVVELDPLPTKEARAAALVGIHHTLDEVGLPYHLAGRLVTQAHYLQATREQLGTLSMMALSLMVVVLLVMFRNVITAFAPLLVSALALLWTFGPMGWLGIGIEPLLSLLPALLLVLGSSFSIYIISLYRTSLATGRSKADAMQHTLHITQRANVLSAVSTAIGFGTLALYPILPLKVFGLAAAWGLFAALLAARTVLPMLTPMLKVNAQPVATRTKLRSAAPLFRNARTIILATVAAVILGFIALPRLRVDNHFLDDLDRTSTLGIDATFFEQHFSGTRPLEITITPTDTLADMLDPLVMQATDSLLRAVQGTFGITRPVGPPDLVRGVMRGTQAGDTLPATDAERKTVRTAMKHYARSSKGTHLLEAELRHGRIMGRTADIGSQAFREHVDRLAPYLHNAHINATITGGAWLMDLANQRIARILVQGILTAILFNALLVGFALRSWRKGLISIVPNVVPLAFAALVMWIFGLPLKVGTAMIFPILYGIALDDSMHFLLHDRSSSLRGTIRTWVALRSSMVNTTIVISAGFGLLAFSSFPSIAIFGGVTAVSLWVALAADLWLLPILLAKLRSRTT